MSCCSAVMVALVALVLGTFSAQGDVEFVPAPRPAAVFAGVPASIHVSLRNTGNETEESSYLTRLVQVSSATRMPLTGPETWKRIRTEPGETITEAVAIRLPKVRVITRFELEILTDGKRIARYPVFACPGDLLQQMVALTGARRVGLFDPEGKLRPVFQQAGVPCVEVALGEDISTLEYALAIFGPFANRGMVPAELSGRAKQLVARNVGVIALLPPRAEAEGTHALQATSPRAGKASIQVLESARGAEDAAGFQLALYRMAEVALGIHPPDLDGTNHFERRN